MMLNMFSIFDPCTSETLSLNWMSVFLAYFFLPMSYFIIPSLFCFSLMEGFKKMYTELILLVKCRFSGMVFSVLMVYMLSYNFMGLFPYIFTLSSHLVFTLTFALSYWMACMLYGWTNFTSLMFSHMLPLGTPSVLMPFMVLIESISLIIRPLTLSVRLAANMIAGHLLLCLVGGSGVMVVLIILFIVFMVQLCLYLLETGVAFIQAYVFSVLSSLYSSDVEFVFNLYRWFNFRITFSCLIEYINYKIINEER